MKEIMDSQSSVMARLTLSALKQVSEDASCWKEQVVHRALLVSGLSVLMAGTQLLKSDLSNNQKL